MKLIADAGGSKIDWRIVGEDSISQKSTSGFNSKTDNLEILKLLLDDNFPEKHDYKEIHFYGAGVDADNDELKEVFLRKFNTGRIHLESDLLGAVRSTYQGTPCWTAILGTGANLGYYDGKQLLRPVPPLGGLLGDEGSGYYMGKKLIVAFLRGELEGQLSERLSRRIGNEEAKILAKCYGEDDKQFLAGLTRFLLQNISHPFVYKLVYDSFKDYFQVFIKESELTGHLNFVGSVAFYFGNILRQVGTDRGVSIGTIAESPIAGLALYHQKH